MHRTGGGRRNTIVTFRPCGQGNKAMADMREKAFVLEKPFRQPFPSLPHMYWHGRLDPLRIFFFNEDSSVAKVDARDPDNDFVS